MNLFDSIVSVGRDTDIFGMDINNNENRVRGKLLEQLIDLEVG